MREQQTRHKCRTGNLPAWVLWLHNHPLSNGDYRSSFNSNNKSKETLQSRLYYMGHLSLWRSTGLTPLVTWLPPTVEWPHQKLFRCLDDLSSSVLSDNSQEAQTGTISLQSTDRVTNEWMRPTKETRDHELWKTNAIRTCIIHLPCTSSLVRWVSVSLTQDRFHFTSFLSSPLMAIKYASLNNCIVAASVVAILRDPIKWVSFYKKVTLPFNLFIEPNSECYWKITTIQEINIDYFSENAVLLILYESMDSSLWINSGFE